ncbi:MAG: oxidoreductase [Gemmatimonadetes bacterium]|nr:oxidoreductase [Gemmatimonadota bacterium]
MVSIQAAAVAPAAGMPSLLPPTVFLLPIVAGFVILAGGRRHHGFCRAIALLTALAVAVLAGWMAWLTVRGLLPGSTLPGVVLTAWRDELRVDALSALVMLVIGGVGLLATLYSATYLEHQPLLDRVGVGRAERRIAIFYALLVWFLGTMSWAAVTNNIVMLYVAVEATTLTSGLLVAFYWDRRGLEAGYKYLMLLTVGITFALFGCVVIYAAGAATGQLHGAQPLLISRVREVASLIPARSALVGVSLLIVGFGMKAGLAPFHPWLPDAHAEAPTPVSVLLSGVMINVALYALARTVSIFFPALPLLTVFLVALGSFSMLLGAVMALVQDDLKRLLAYSSVSQMGYVLAGVAVGTYLGAFGGLFHLLNHALIKALLFMAAGAVIYATGIRRVSSLGGLASRMPVTSACFIIGALAIAGFPPFNGFMSKLTVYLALADSGLWWAVGIAVFTSLVTLVAFVRPAMRVFWAAPASPDPALLASREVPVALWVPMVVLAAVCLLLGIAPGLAHGLLDRAAVLIATVGG